MSSVKTAAALVGGYILGRTKKAKLAISVGLWLKGHKASPADLVRDQVAKFLKSPDGEKLVAQVRGPAMEAGVRAVTAVYEAQAKRMAETLQQRTARISESLGRTAGGTASTGQAAGQAVTGTVGDTAAGLAKGLAGGKPQQGEGAEAGAETGEGAESARAETAGDQEPAEQDSGDQRRPQGRSASGRRPEPRV